MGTVSSHRRQGVNNCQGVAVVHLLPTLDGRFADLWSSGPAPGRRRPSRAGRAARRRRRGSADGRYRYSSRLATTDTALRSSPSFS